MRYYFLLILCLFVFSNSASIHAVRRVHNPEAYSYFTLYVGFQYGHFILGSSSHVAIDDWTYINLNSYVVPKHFFKHSFSKKSALSLGAQSGSFGYDRHLIQPDAYPALVRADKNTLFIETLQ